MWIIDSEGEACNLAQACVLYTSKKKDGVQVRASFPVNDLKAQCAANVTIKTFDNVDDAKEFIKDIVAYLNCGEGYRDWYDLTRRLEDNNPLGYSFSWLKKIEALPAEERTKLENKIKIWLDENVVGSGMFHGTQGEVAAKKTNVPTSGENLIDGIPL